jgi:hypothetical protein
VWLTSGFTGPLNLKGLAITPDIVQDALFFRGPLIFWGRLVLNWGLTLKWKQNRYQRREIGWSSVLTLQYIWYQVCSNTMVVKVTLQELVEVERINVQNFSDRSQLRSQSSFVIGSTLP